MDADRALASVLPISSGSEGFGMSNAGRRRCKTVGTGHVELSWSALWNNVWPMMFSWWPAYQAVDGYHCMHSAETVKMRSTELSSSHWNCDPTPYPDRLGFNHSGSAQIGWVSGAWDKTLYQHPRRRNKNGTRSMTLYFHRLSQKSLGEVPAKKNCFEFE